MANGPHQLQGYLLSCQEMPHPASDWRRSGHVSPLSPLLCQERLSALVGQATAKTFAVHWQEAWICWTELLFAWMCYQDGIVLLRPLHSPQAAWLTLSGHVPIWHPVFIFPKHMVSRELNWFPRQPVKCLSLLSDWDPCSVVLLGPVTESLKHRARRDSIGATFIPMPLNSCPLTG